MSAPDPSGTGLVPVTILTGFLGSGKTTLLNRLLKQPALAGAAVIVNEFGEVGLDHLLIEASEEQFALLDNGCVCCTVRGDLVETLKALDARSRAGEIPALTRVVIETTGLADPAPILHTLMVDAELARRFRIGGVVATVDAVNGWPTLDRHVEAARQVAVADRLVITKTDLAGPEETHRLRRRLMELAPTAEQTVAQDGSFALLLADAAFLDAGADADRVVGWFQAATQESGHTEAGHDCGPGCAHHHRLRGRHHGIQSYSFVIDAPVHWAAFARWLDYVTALKGEDLLRLKGLVHVAEEPEKPLVLHGVQHVLHPPTRLDAWPSDDRRTRLVFIVRDIPRETIERTLVKFAAVDVAGIRTPAAA